MNYKVITLIEPWGTLIALGAKKIETRSWRTNYRGPLAIHAGKSVNMDVLSNPHFQRVLTMDGKRYKTDFPRGQIIAVCKLVDCVQITSNTITGEPMAGSKAVGIPERFFGDYAPGRWAWLLDEIKILENPVTVKGSLGLWNYNGILK